MQALKNRAGPPPTDEEATRIDAVDHHRHGSVVQRISTMKALYKENEKDTALQARGRKSPSRALMAAPLSLFSAFLWRACFRPPSVPIGFHTRRRVSYVGVVGFHRRRRAS